jgi:hypothetical protein
MSPVALPTKPQVRKASPLDARVFLGGQPKVGKTTLASQWNPKHTLFLDCEGGTRMLEGDHFVQPIKSFQEFVEAVDALAKGEHSYHTIIVDTIDQLVKFCDHHVASGRGALAAGVVDYGKGLAELEALIRRDLGRLLALGHGVWMLGHTELVEVNKVQRMIPTVDKRVRGYVLGACDFVLQAEAMGTKRVLHTQPSERFEAGSRVPMPEPLEMDSRKLWAAMAAGLKAQEPDEPDAATEADGGEDQ